MLAPTTLPELLACAAAGALPGRGVRAKGQALPWTEVQALALGFARALASHDLQRGERVAVYLEPSVEQAVSLFGAACAGAIVVPVNPKLRDAQVAHVLRDSDARVVVTSAAKLAFLADADATFGERTRVVVGGEGAGAFAAFSAAGGGAPLPTVTPDDLAVLLYTSGSTGLPKGVVQDHRNLVAGARIVSGYLGLGADDRILGVLPLAFDYGLNQLLDAAWLAAEVTLAGFFTPADLVDLVAAEGATVLAGVPPMWAALADALRRGQVERQRLASLRVLTNSGGRLYGRDSAALRQALPQAQVFSMYGLTEAFRSSYVPPAELARRPDSIGKAIPEVELLVVDPATGRRCGPGETGELVHAGALVARGYWNDPGATARRFRPHPFDPARGTVVYSGDLVRADADGYLSFVARADAQLKVAGHRVSPDEVETVVNRTPGVVLAVVVGVADEVRADTRLVVFVEPGAGAGDVSDRVRAACRRELPAYLVPAEIRLVDAMPLNENGKPDRAALRRLAMEGAK